MLKICILIFGSISGVYIPLMSSQHTASNIIDAKLILSIKDHDIKKAKYCLTIGADPNTKDAHNTPALALACEECEPDVVRMLIIRGASVDGPDATKWQNTPLIWASSQGCESCASLLLHHRAKINKTTTDGRTALMAATDLNQLNCMRLLLKRGANINLSESKGFTALMSAVVQHNTKAVKLLVTHGANVNAVSSSGDTALKIARRESVAPIVNILISYGAKI